MNGYYINLDYRLDRKKHMDGYKKNISFFNKLERFSAIKNDAGFLGCALSHINVLKKLLNKKGDYFMICEDDLQIIYPKVFNQFLTNFRNIKDSLHWDMITLTPFFPKINNKCVDIMKNNNFIKLDASNTTTCYIIKRTFIDKLIENFKTATSYLLKGDRHTAQKYAIDKYWKVLHETDNIYSYKNIFASQLKGYSDIEKVNVNYSNHLGKSGYIKNECGTKFIPNQKCDPPIHLDMIEKCIKKINGLIYKMCDTTKLNIAICGCTINSASYIKKNIQNLDQIRDMFKSVDIIVYENDSKDNTVHILREMHNNGIIKLISEKGIKQKYKNIKTQILAHGRNNLIEYVTKNKYDYMIMIDLDALDVFNIDGIKHAFEYDTTKWDVLTGNCKERYYDIWALRMNKRHGTATHSKIWKTVLDYDCWDMFWHLQQNIKPSTRKKWNADMYLLRRYCIGNFQKHISYDFPLLQVESAFNGIGIYNVSKIKNCKYSAKYEICTCKSRGIKDSCSNYIYKMGGCCEHIAFHKDIREKNGGKIFICPKLIIADQKEHWV
jgi:glycosyl transferase family 25